MHPVLAFMCDILTWGLTKPKKELFHLFQEQSKFASRSQKEEVVTTYLCHARSSSQVWRYQIDWAFDENYRNVIKTFSIKTKWQHEYVVRIQTEVWSKSLFKGLTSNLWFSNFSLVVGLCRWKGALWINQNNFRSVKHVLEKQSLLSKVRLVHMRSIHCCVNDKIVHIGIKIHWELMLSRWSLGIILY